MSETMLAALTSIRTAEDMIVAFRDEEQCRRLLESMVWPAGRVCPACGYKRSIAIAGRDMGKRRARPGLYQCSSGDCRFQFTVTTHTPLHSTKLPLSVWLKGMWLILQSDKGLSSVRLAEALGVSQPTAWRMGHALRLMAARERMLDGTVEIDHFHLGGRPRINPDDPPPGRGRKGLPNTQKTPVMVMVQRPDDVTPGTPAGDARAAVVTGLSLRAAARAAGTQIDPDACLMSDEATAFIALGEAYARHDTVKHSSREYVRDAVHVNSVEGFNARVRRTIAGVFHHISP
ncbi:ISSod11, transposase (plasmid) [Sinorhizobium americanum CCGM7]|nr:ISSod11, transposase [Sinorhizobium americanum CCGM7]